MRSYRETYGHLLDDIKNKHTCVTSFEFDSKATFVCSSRRDGVNANMTGRNGIRKSIGGHNVWSRIPGKHLLNVEHHKRLQALKLRINFFFNVKEKVMKLLNQYLNKPILLIVNKVKTI